MIYIGEIAQETNSFSGASTTLDDFKASGLSEGMQILETLNGKWAIDGYVTVLSEAGLMDSVTPVINAHSVPGGRITEDCLAYFKNYLCRAFANVRDDVLLLGMHGAMSSAEVDDAEGYLLSRIRRQVGPDVLIVLVLDHHANITAEIMDSVDFVVGYQDQPHLPFAAGEKAARLFLEIQNSGHDITTAWRKIPMIAPQDKFLTTIDGAMKEWFDLARQYEGRPEVLSVSPFPMQPWLDVSEGGWSVVVHTSGNQPLADEIADQMADRAWNSRAQFWESERLPVDEAVIKADNSGDDLVIISDTGDAVFAGAFGDGTQILESMVRLAIEHTAYIPLVDPAAVEKLHSLQAGDEVTLQFGGSVDKKYNKPQKVTGILRGLRKDVEIQISWGRARIGDMALFQVGNIYISIAQRPTFAVNSPESYTIFGLKIEDCRMVVLKTGSNFQGFDKWPSTLLRADTAGISQSRLQDFPWRHLPRPIYPLDEIENRKL